MSNIQVTNIDPGEGQPLVDDNFIAVYGGQSLLDTFYPVGTYYETSNRDFDPNIAWGGLWEEDSAGRVTVSQDSGTFATLGGRGGEETHKLVVNELPEHTHTYSSGRWAWAEQGGGGDIINSQSETSYRFTRTSGKTGGNIAHNNLQPYVIVRRWHRIA